MHQVVEPFVLLLPSANIRAMRAISITALLGASLLGQHAAALPSEGCQADHAVALEQTYNVQMGDRRYLLWFPANYRPTTPAPVVLSYHGGTRVAEEQQRLDLLSTGYFNQEYIVVYPNGVNVSPGLPSLPEDSFSLTPPVLGALS